jgi:hypothetical protein
MAYTNTNWIVTVVDGMSCMKSLQLSLSTNTDFRRKIRCYGHEHDVSNTHLPPVLVLLIPSYSVLHVSKLKLSVLQPPSSRETESAKGKALLSTICDTFPF